MENSKNSWSSHLSPEWTQIYTISDIGRQPNRNYKTREDGVLTVSELRVDFLLKCLPQSGKSTASFTGQRGSKLPYPTKYNQITRGHPSS